MKRLVIHSDGFEGYAKRALVRARKVDQGEEIEPEITITFENPLNMIAVLTEARLRLIDKVKKRSLSVSALARELNRDLRSVRRDVGKLERAGVVRTRQQANPGHGRAKIVEPAARNVKLEARV